MTRKAGKIYHWAIGPHMWKRFVILWNVPVKKCSFENVSSRCFCSSPSNLLVMPGNHFLSPSESVVWGVSLHWVCGAGHGLALLYHDAFWKPAPGSQESLPVPLSLKCKGKGKSCFSKMLSPWDHAERACENTHGYAHTQSSGFGRVGIKPRELTFLNS